MPISPLALCDACQDAYLSPALYSLSEIDGTLVIAGRGTELANVADIMADIDFLPDYSLTMGMIPRGFHARAIETFPEIVRLTAGRPFGLVGHSLGGAWALVTAAKLVHAGTPPLVVTTFESPRVGRLGGLIETMAGVDFVNGDDPVPLLPLGYPAPRPVTRIGQPLLDPIDCHYLRNVRVALMGLQVAA